MDDQIFSSLCCHQNIWLVKESYIWEKKVWQQSDHDFLLWEAQNKVWDLYMTVTSSWRWSCLRLHSSSYWHTNNPTHCFTSQHRNITPLGSGPGNQVCDSVVRLHINSKRWVSTECPAQIGTRPHVMDLKVPRGSKTRNVREDEFFAGSWRARIDDENMDTLGWCACIIFRRRNGRGTRESSERLSRRSNGSVLAESEEFLVGYNANFFGGELRELLNKVSDQLCIGTREELISHQCH